jgi:hypothetical protein
MALPVMTEYRTGARIAASPEQVWAVLTNGAAYSSWNPEIVGIDGVMALNARIVAHVRLGSGAVRHVPQQVPVFDAPRRLEWLSGLPFGLFVGRRIFTVTPVAGGADFLMHLQMSGPLATWILKPVGNRQPEIDQFTRALKQRVESLE